MGAPSLHVWQPAEGPADRLTLTLFFLDYAWPQMRLQGRKFRTRSAYLSSLDHWARLTGDPPVAELCGHQGKALLMAFYQRLEEELPNPNTRFKHWSNLQHLLDWCGPATRQNRDGFGIVDQPAYVAGPAKEKRPVKRGFSLGDLWRWIEVLPRSPQPLRGKTGPAASLDPSAWWRAVIVFAYNTGLRPETIFGARWEHLAPCQEDVCPRRCQEGEVGGRPGGARCRAAHVFSPPRDIVKRGLERTFWLNHAALEAIEPLRRQGAETELIFGWDWDRRYNSLNRARVRQQQAAGLDPFQLSLYALRRTFATEAAKINPLAMRMQMGHDPGEFRMAAEHYIFQPAVVAAALEQLPQPGPARQKRLFD